MKVALSTTAIAAAALGFAMRAEVAATPAMWAALLVPYLVGSLLALRRLHHDGTLSDVMRPRSGDITVGFFIAALVFAGAYAVRVLAFAPGSPRLAWLYRVALQLGSLAPSAALLGGVVAVALLEELTWRGLVLSAVTDALGTRRAWPVTALLYAAAHVPTYFTLADPTEGGNPLLVLAALGAGLVWSFAASILGRLPPVLVSHAVFTYFAVTVLLPRLG